jgi:hypothetical protein
MKMTLHIKKPNFALLSFTEQIAKIALLQQSRSADLVRWKNDQLKPKTKAKKTRAVSTKTPKSIINTIAKSRISNEDALNILKQQLKALSEGT